MRRPAFQRKDMGSENGTDLESASWTFIRRDKCGECQGPKAMRQVDGFFETLTNRDTAAS
jgi:hypothetical protein